MTSTLHSSAAETRPTQVSGVAAQTNEESLHLSLRSEEKSGPFDRYAGQYCNLRHVYRVTVGDARLVNSNDGCRGDQQEGSISPYFC